MSNLPKLRRFEPVILQHGPNGVPFKVEKGWRHTSIKVKCPLCNRWVEQSKEVAGRLEREDGAQSFFLCRVCGNAKELREGGEGLYQISGHWWHWIPIASKVVVK